MKWWDAQLLVTGGKEKGNSCFAAEIIMDYDRSIPSGEGSKMVRFAELLGGAVANAQGGTRPGWKVESDGPEESHTLEFG